VSALATLLEAAPRYAQLLRSQYWPAERLHAYQEERLKATLTAAAKIPFYAERFGDAACVDDFRRLPFLRRSEVDLLHRSARSLYPPGSRFAQASSSGTSGARAECIFDRYHQRGRHAARARYLRANGWNPIERTAWLIGGRFLNSPDIGDDDSQFARERLLIGVKFLVNSIALPELADAIARLNPVFLYLYPSILDGLLRSFGSAGLKLPSLRRIFCGAEVLEPSLRDRTRTQLGVSIVENYGSTEAFIAWQCPAGSYHLNAEHVLIELVDDTGRAVAPGQMGRVLLTTLENYLMPLIRYEIGDYAIAANGACSCGRTLPLIGRIVGRGMNLFRTADGKLATTWDLVNVVRQLRDVATFQIVQKSPDRILIKYVAQSPIGPEAESEVRSGFVPYMGPAVSIEFECVSEIPRTPGGKFMLTLSEVSA
jgi:phenylacetate-CoA ligase